MAFEKDNQYWKLRSKHGRKRIIEDPQTLIDASNEYFEWCMDNPIKTYDYKGKDAKKVEYELPRVFQKAEVAMWCHLSEWRLINDLKKVSDDFSQAITHIEGIIASQKYRYAVTNIFNSNIVARDLSLSDKTETKVKVDTEGIDYSKLSDQALEEISNQRDESKD